MVTSGLAPAVNVASLALISDVSIGATLALSAGGQMVVQPSTSSSVDVGRVVGPPDTANLTIPVYINID